MKIKLAGYLLVALSFFLIPTQQGLAHPGRTDSSGGHTCRTNCEKYALEYGEYHYHNGGGSTAPSAPSPAPAPAPRPAPKPPAVPVPVPVPVQKKSIETLNGLVSNKASNALWVDLILAEVSKNKTTPDFKTINPSAAASSRIVGATQATKIENDSKFYYVSSVTDGDTIKVVVDGKIEKVRLLGIDTPETKDPRKPVQCFGQQASDFTKALVEGKYVRLEIDKSQGNRDKYNRLLRYVYLQDGTEVNAKLVEQGYAFAYLRYPVSQTETYKRLQSNAQTNKLGLWSSCR